VKLILVTSDQNVPKGILIILMQSLFVCGNSLMLRFKVLETYIIKNL
jgi:ABC-type Fe3+ transport system permease subunit